MLLSALLFYVEIRAKGVALFGFEDPDLASGLVGAILPILILSTCAFLSTAKKSLVLGFTGALVAIILFYIGIGRAYLLARFDPGIGFGHFGWNVCYSIGVLGPILVLGICVALIGLMRKAKNP